MRSYASLSLRIPMGLLTVLFLGSSVLASPASGTDWTQFRGPNGGGVSQAEGLPESLSPNDNATWKIDMPGGYSSPILTDDLILATAFRKRDLLVMGIERANGEIRWTAKAPKPLEEDPRGPNTPVSSTPATDGEAVYVFFPHFGLVAYDLEGGELWTHELGPFNNPYGMSSSPVLHGDTLLLLCDQDTDSYLLALDKESGEQKWKADRHGSTHGFSSPVVYQPDEGEAEVIISGSYETVGYSFGGGEKLWWVKGLAWQAKSVPVLDGDMMYLHSWMAGPSELGLPKITASWEETLETDDKDGDGKLSKDEAPSAFHRLWFLYDLDKDDYLEAEDWEYVLARGRAKNGLFAIELGGRGDITETHTRWRYRRSLPNIPSPLFYGDVLYLLKEGGILTSIDPESGEAIKSERIPDAQDPYYASPIAADGKIYTASQSGNVAVISADPEWEVLSVSAFGEEIWGTPAIGQGEIFVRTQSALYCFRAAE